MKRKTAALLALPAFLLVSCGASTPAPPDKICGVAAPKKALLSLAPEGEKITVERSRSSRYAPEHRCSISVDKKYFLSVQHDPDGQHYTRGISDEKSAKFTPQNFEGEATGKDTRAEAVAECKGRKNPVYGSVRTDVEVEGRSYKQNRELLEEFINAYMPHVQERYGCKS